jgi:hypothetical protein
VLPLFMKEYWVSFFEIERDSNGWVYAPSPGSYKSNYSHTFLRLPSQPPEVKLS